MLSCSNSNAWFQISYIKGSKIFGIFVIAATFNDFKNKLRSKRWRWKKVLNKYLPFTDWLFNYKIKQDLMADIVAGITIAIMNIPQGATSLNKKYHHTKHFNREFQCRKGISTIWIKFTWECNVKNYRRFKHLCSLKTRIKKVLISFFWKNNSTKGVNPNKLFFFVTA